MNKEKMMMMRMIMERSEKRSWIMKKREILKMRVRTRYNGLILWFLC